MRNAGGLAMAVRDREPACPDGVAASVPLSPGRDACMGAGVALKHQHHRDFLAGGPPVGWVEVHSENYLGGGKHLAALEAVRGDYPVSLHGVGLSLGTAGPLDRAHLDRVADLTRRIEPALVSEHLSWSVTGGVFLADLLPLPYTEEALEVFCGHVREVQDALQRQILVENPSTYLQFAHSTIPEWEFVAAIVERTGCALLLDVNNVYVSACNNGFDPETYLAGIPADAVREVHLAGHSVRRIGDAEIRIDDHGSPVCEEVWQLYATAMARLGPVSTLIEWDMNVPELATLVAEAEKARPVLERAIHDARA